MSRRHGFTAIELLISAALLATLLLAGVVASRSATVVAGDSVRTSAAERRAALALDRVRDLLSLAARSTLQATPAGGGPLESMQDGVAYDNVSFRRLVENGPSGPVYDPDPALPPYALDRRVRANPGTEGDLVWDDGQGGQWLCGGLQDLQFVKQGSRVTVRVVAAIRGVDPQSHVSTSSLVLRNP